MDPMVDTVDLSSKKFMELLFSHGCHDSGEKAGVGEYMGARKVR